MTTKDIQNYINALCDDHAKADKALTNSISRGIESGNSETERDERSRQYGRMFAIREALVHMDFYLPGSKRMVRRAIEKIDPAFAKGYYDTKYTKTILG